MTEPQVLEATAVAQEMSRGVTEAMTEATVHAVAGRWPEVVRALRRAAGSVNTAAARIEELTGSRKERVH